MKKHLLIKMAAGFIGLVLAGLTAQAQSITGEISFSGGATLNDALSTATGFSSIFGPLGEGTNPEVNSGATGSYANVPVYTPVNFTPFIFNPAPVSSFQLWSFNDAGVNYNFDVTAITYRYQSASFLNLAGTGVAYITNLQPTVGTWSISDTGSAGPVFSFGNVLVVPEPTTSVLIFAFGVVAAAKRRFRSSK